MDVSHKTIIAIVGASAMMIVGIISQSEAFYSQDLGVDWNVIILLVSMMTIINIMKPTGVFEYIAIKSAKTAKSRTHYDNDHVFCDNRLCLGVSG